MTCKFSAAATAFAVLLSANFTTQALAEVSQVEIAYEEPAKAELRPIYEQLKQMGVLQELQNFMKPLHLPRPITVRTAQCGDTSLPYTPGGPATICYEMVDQVSKLAQEHSRDKAYQQLILYGAVIEAVLHESALAIFDTLQVPIWGREFDAADRLAALMMTQFGEDVMKLTIESTSQIFQWSNRSWTGQAFSSTDSPEAQRYFNYLCVAYGAQPYDYAYLARGGLLPEERAGRCADEYLQIKKAFDLRIMPYIDPDALVEAKSKRWLMMPPGLGQNG